MKYIVLVAITDSIHNVPVISNYTTFSKDLWFWITIIEFLLILILIFRIRQKEKNIFDSTFANTIADSKNVKVDMDDVMSSINNSRELYKKLSTKCHPDLFIDIELNKKATDIFQEITKNKRDYKKLLEIKEKAKNQLKITI